MAGPGFVHLHVHSSYSLLESALTIARLAELAKADRQPALALTDTDNMFGALEFSEKLAGYGIQPIVGCSLAVDFGDQETRAGLQPPPHPRIVLLAVREDGYRSLMRLNSRAFLETAPTEKPHVKLSWLEGETAGLIALTGGPAGPLDAAIESGQIALSGTRFETLARHFGDRLYVELQRHSSERAAEDALIELAYSRGVPLVATNAPLFATREDYEAHDALICIAEGRYLAESDRRQFTPEHRFKTRAEMMTLFSDLPEALASTVEIAQRCAFRPRTCAPMLPRFLGRRGERQGRRGGRTAQARRGRIGAPHQGSRARTRANAGGVPRPARLRAQRDRADEVSRLLPDRVRLHPVGEAGGHPGRAGARLGRRIGGRLCADHHRPRSAAVQPAVRALPQSGARVDAGLRHRLLPGPARRGHPLRPGALRQRAGGADHHLRHAAGARRAARRRPRAADAVRPGRQALQARAAEPGQPGQARPGDRRRAAAAGRARQRSGGAARLRHRPQARGPAPPRLDPCRRHRDRRAARSTRWSRSTAIRNR